MLLSILAYLTSIISLLVSVLYTWMRKRFLFWKELGVPFAEPSFPCGNVGELIVPDKHFGYFMQNWYDKLKHHGDFAGLYFFAKPTIIVLSPEFAKTVLIKDFSNFFDRGIYWNETSDPLSANLFFMEGQKWKNLREKISPTFTSGKMKMMFETIATIAERLVEYLDETIEDSEEVEISDLAARFTTDTIASCAFGLECNSINEPDTQFRQIGRKVFKFSKFQKVKLTIGYAFRNLCRAFNMRILDKDASQYFMNIVRDTIEYRQKNKVIRNDFLQLLLKMYNKGEFNVDNEEVVGQLTFEEIAAQCFIFFFAGFDTSSNTIAFALHSLAFNQDVQDIAREEVNRILSRHGNKFSYEALAEMEYLERVILETQRLYPTVSTIVRVTTKEYELPNGKNIPEGVGCIIPTLGFHRDAEIFPNPMKFNPDRFTPENKLNRHQCAFLAFSEGPRVCIGMRFGILQSKIGLAMLLRHYRFDVGENTEKDIKIDPLEVLFTPVNGISLKVTKINENIFE